MVQASSEKVRRAADASIAAHEQQAQEAAKHFEELQAQEQQAQAQLKALKGQLAGMRATRSTANNMLFK